MKEKTRKILIIFSAMFLAAFSTLAYPMQQAQAAPIVAGAVPAGITLGAGAYTVGALALAGVVGVAGYDTYSDEINAHAKGVWEGGTQTAMDSLNWSIDQSISAGNSVVEMGAGFVDWAGSTINNLAAETVNITNESITNGTFTTTHRYTVGTYGIGESVLTSDTAIFARGIGSTYSNQAFVQVFQSSGDVTFQLPGLSVKFTKAQHGLDTAAIQQEAGNLKSINSFNSFMLKIYTAAGAASTYNPVTHKSLELQYSNGISKTKEAWESMRDAGLVLPTDSAVPLSSVDATPLNYNADTDTYTGIDGGVYTGTPAWAFPQPRIRVANPDIPGSVPTTGVYVDTPVLTGNPTYDDALTSNPDIPMTTTNVQTGITVGNPDFATSTPLEPIVAVPPAVPSYDSPGTTGLDFTPLMMTGSAMTNKFPFSIPFDFVKQLSILDVEPQAPVFDINIPEFLKIGGFIIPFKMKLSFEMFDPIANIIRWGMIIIFDISLIFAIRKLLPE